MEELPLQAILLDEIPIFHQGRNTVESQLLFTHNRTFTSCTFRKTHNITVKSTVIHCEEKLLAEFLF